MARKENTNVGNGKPAAAPKLPAAARAAAPRKRRTTVTSIPGPVEISVPIQVAEAPDLAMPFEASSLEAAVGASSQDIARRAYEIFVEQGFQHGHDLEHWLAAEQELRAGRR
jgi:hypothetical protein